MPDATKKALTCAYCGGPAEGNYSIHRDGFDVGPEVELCDEHGGHEKPTCEEIWDRIAQPAEAPATSDTRTSPLRSCASGASSTSTWTLCGSRQRPTRSGPTCPGRRWPVAERPIIFNDAMARAVRDGTKTVTRRPVKSNSGPPPTLVHRKQGPRGRHWTEPGGWVPAPAAVGDVLWVRECFAPSYFGPGSHGYRADWTREAADVVPMPRWTPSIHMPRTAARIHLRVTSVRVERVQAITEDGARAEGCFFDGHAWFPGEWHGMPGFAHGRDAFATLWDGIYAAKGLGWEANPWCWVIEFERAEVSR